jgi:hypothetical protein
MYGEMRSDAKSWVCVVCGKKAYDVPLCFGCQQTEKDKQRAEPGSITEKQCRYIEHLLTKLTTNESSAFFPDGWDGEIENLSANQAGKIVSDLLALLEVKKEFEESKKSEDNT